MNNLKSINIKNFKCFSDVSFSIKDINILIGENNAGKSTTIEAITLIAYGIEKLKNGKYTQCPIAISENHRDKCIKLNIESLLIDISNANYKYDKTLTPKITAYFNNNSRVEIYIIDEEVYAIGHENKSCIINKKDAANADLPDIFVMPHFSLLKNREKYINEKTTAQDQFNYRSSLHFRNEIYNNQDKLAQLNNLISLTWNGLFLNVQYEIFNDDFISINIRDKDFNTEIRNYGSGLQMWVQFLWFLCKINKDNCIVILDEPDVYIHADLQRKLYHIVADRFPQTLIATHSIEIINEASLSNIMIVDKNSKRFKFCKDKSTLSNAMKSIGSTQNIMLTKIQKYNKCLFVEGNDLYILDDLFRIVINDKTKSLKDFANCKLNGKDNYKEIFGASKLFKEDSNGTFRTFCLLDKDYNAEYNSKIIEDAYENSIELHILNRLEIENYIIVPRIYAEIIGKPQLDIENEIFDLATKLKDVTFDRILEAKILGYKKINPKKSITQICKETRDYINSKWNTLNEILLIVPGKELKGMIYTHIKSKYGKSCSDKIILQKMKLNDIPLDLRDFLRKLGE